MKKTFVVLGTLMLVVVMGVFVGCKPEDTTPPEISITVKATDNYRSELFSDSIKVPRTTKVFFKE